MSIRVVRNDAGNCINFYGTSNPTYWNACLSASIDETFPTRINVRNDIRSAEEGSDVYEFFQIPYTTFVDKDGNSFESPAEAAQYITDNANVSGDTGTFIFSETDTLDAQREATNTTVLFSNGDIYAVNALRAVDTTNGTITIRTIRGDKDIYTNIRYYNVTVNNGAVSFNTISAAVDRLNEVLTGGNVGTDGGDVTGDASTQSNPTTFEVYGSRLTETGSGSTLGYTSTLETGNFDTSNGILSVQSISEAGEYFEFSQDSGDWTNTVGLTFGLFDETTYDRSDLEVDVAGNAVKSILRLRVKNSGFLFKDPASTYGRLNESGLSNQLDTRTTFRVGLDSERRGYISMQLEDGTYQNVGRTETAIATDTVLKFLAIFPLANEMNGIRNMTVNTIVVAPTLTWHYIESPDGSFYYPLFATAAEANYVDEQYGTAADGAGASHTHIFPDEQPSVNTWYMPSSYMFHDQASAPTLAGVTYNEINTGADSSYVPTDLTLNNQNFSENHGVNLQIVPAGDTPATVTGLPPGLTYANGFITGTTSYVPEDITYTVTVVRSNSYGSNTQTFTITIQDNSSLGNLSNFTELDGNYLQPNRVFLDYDAVLQYDTQISPEQEMTYSYTSGQLPPTIGILNTVGESRITSYDSATHTLGTGDYDFAETNKWDLRYVTFSGDVGSGNVKHRLVGWTTNTEINGSEGTNIGVEFKLEYGLDGYIKLYRGDSLLVSSASTFTGPQTLTFAGFDNQAQSDLYIPSNLTITTSGAGTSTPPSGFVDPLLQGEMGSTTILGNGADAVVRLTQDLKVNHRLVISQEWIEQNLFPMSASGDFYIGIPKTTLPDWTNGLDPIADFDACIKLSYVGSSSHQSILADGTSTHTQTVGSGSDAYYEYGLEWDGTNLYVIACNTNDLNTTTGIADGGTFVRYHVYAAGEYGSVRTGDLPVVFAVNANQDVSLNTSGLNHIRIPFSAQTILAGESSDGNGDFKITPSNTDYDSVPNGHAPSDFAFADITSLSAGQTYKFIYHPSLEDDDFIEFRLASDNTTVYTTGITTFDNAPSSDPQVTGGYKGLTFAVPADAPPLRLYHYNSSGSYDAGRAVSISGSTYVEPITGITQEGPAANQTGTNIFDASDHGWLSIDEQLGAGERLVLSGTFLSDVADAMGDNTILNFGVKDTSWANTISDFNTGFEGGIRFTLIRYSSTSIQMYMYKGESPTAAGSTLYTTVAGLTSYNAFLEVTSTGNNVRGGVALTSTNDATTDAYADWATTTKIQSGDQGYGITSIDVMVQGFALSGTDTTDADDIDWTGLSEISIPASGGSLTTPWTKALDFSGSSERALQVTNLSSYNPIRMADVSSTVSAHTSFTSGTHASDRADSRPWACAVVFSSDNNASNQHIWNQGEGAGSTDDNIYLRVDSSRNLYFGWGRSGALNECQIETLSSTTGTWYGVYIAHTGERLSGSNATAANLADCFDIRIVDLSTGTVGSNLAISANWTTTGGRMDRIVAGDFTVGGRGSNRNFHGKVASMVVTTLKRGQTMPTTTEISEMVRDPQQWQIDYKNGQDFRPSISPSTSSNFTGTSHYNHTQIWLMGDGANDAYAQIRNDVSPNTQGGASLNMISMVSNDIQTVNISGLS